MKPKTLIAAVCCLICLSAITVVKAQSKDQHRRETAFDFDRNLIFVEVRINGKGPLRMMLDTGTDPSAIDLAAARRLGLKIKATGGKTVGGGTASNEVYTVKPVDVTVGRLKARNVEVSVTDLSGIAKALGKPVHGVLGHSFLNNRVVQIDYPKQVVRFYRKGSKALPTTERRTVLPFRYKNESILIQDVAVNGKGVTTLFDTGLNSVFAVMPSAIEELKLEAEFNKATPVRSAGFNGPSAARKGTVPEVKIGNITAASPSVVFWEKGTGHDTTTYALTVGNGFLKDYVVTIDYINHVIILEKG